MKRDTWIVTKSSSRPAGKPDRCFYCSNLIGEEHKQDCVIRNKTVVMDFTIRLVVDVPEYWTEDDIEFKYNKGTWCADNLVQMITREDGRCLCPHVEAKFIRDATLDDEENWGLIRVEDLES
ncbi:hypothetical protein ACYCSU_17025 [Paenibacillus sp. ALE1]